ncbi:MAG: hypothetical protein P4L68_08115 [Methylovirgula sp.]|nr:hypothetical protein [Methylovirgula sp.]
MSLPGRFQSARCKPAEKSARGEGAMRLAAGVAGLGSILILISALAFGGHV